MGSAVSPDKIIVLLSMPYCCHTRIWEYAAHYGNNFVALQYGHYGRHSLSFIWYVSTIRSLILGRCIYWGIYLSKQNVNADQISLVEWKNTNYQWTQPTVINEPADVLTRNDARPSAVTRLIMNCTCIESATKTMFNKHVMQTIHIFLIHSFSFK